MSEAMPQAEMSPLAARVLGAARRLVLSALPFVVVIALWQFASLFFPRFLFPSLIDVFWRWRWCAPARSISFCRRS